MKQLNIKTPTVLRMISVAFLCVMVFTLHMLGDTYAKYLSGATGNATVSVADFSVSCSSSDNNTTKTMEIGSEETVTYSFTVTNTSTLIQTGQLIWPIPVLAISGMLLIAAGIVLLQKKRKTNA